MNTKKRENTIKSNEKTKTNDVNIYFNSKDIGNLLKMLIASFPNLLSNRKKLISLTLVITGGLAMTTNNDELITFIEKTVKEAFAQDNTNYKEHQIKFEEVCDYLKVNRPKFKEKVIGETNPRLIENNKLWPVFNWRCDFQIVTQPTTGAKKYFLSTGIHLTDEYCQPKYGKDFLSYYKNYEDPNSWYCTHVQ